MKNRITILLLIFSLFLFINSGKNTELSGKWKCGSSVIEFNTSGTHFLKFKGDHFKFKIEGIELVLFNGTRYKFKLENEKLHVFYPDEILIYKRKP